MSEDQKTSLTNELNTLAQKLGEAVRTTLASPQRREIEQEVRAGFENVVTEINEALAKARQTDATKQLEEQAEKLVGTVKSSKVTAEARQGLIKGLQTLNQQLDEIITRLNEGETAPGTNGQAETEPETADVASGN